jgi:hypothetical protein
MIKLASVGLALTVSTLPARATDLTDIAPPDPAASETAGFDAGRVGFSIRINDEIEADYRTFATLVMPGERVSLSSNEAVAFSTENGLETLSTTDAVWQAPDTPGHHVIEIRNRAGGLIRLNAFVLRPATEIEAGVLQGYAIGQYPQEPYRGHDAYLPPAGFIEVPPELHDLPISPHFTLGQFLCKQEGGPVRYAVVRERLLLKLERLLEEVNAHGWRTDGFVVMSGYRTPVYNAGIGNGRYSRHVYGGAADIYIDEDGDGIMDDLNRDGVLDRQDAAALYDFIDRMLTRPDWTDFHGGLGEYGSTSAHGPFVHVDERGWNARWGRS